MEKERERDGGSPRSEEIRRLTLIFSNTSESKINVDGLPRHLEFSSSQK